SAANNLFSRSPEVCVRDALRGLVIADPSLALIARTGSSSSEGVGGVVIRREPRGSPTGNWVRVISGGGAGHEPAYVGFVGEGLLDAAVSGHVFASPAPNDILEAIRQLACPSGLLVLIMNYTGDRLNFGLAAARARTSDLRCRMFVCDDDASIKDPAPAVGRRGIAGSLLMMKLACGLADSGLDLDCIVDRLESLRTRLATVGTCRLPTGDWELGLGIHGEAGVGLLKSHQSSMEAVVGAVVKKLLADERIEKSMNKVKKQESSSSAACAMLINGLGGLSNLELSGIASVAFETVTAVSNLPVRRLYIGNLMTSLSAPGFSVSLLLLLGQDDEGWILETLDLPARRWPAASSPSVLRPDQLELAALPSDPTSASSDSSIPWQSAESLSSALASLSAVAAALIDARSILNQLDSVGGLGDGDCGDTMYRGAVAMQKFVEQPSNAIVTVSSGPRRLLAELSSLAQSDMGGSSGALFGIGLAAAAASVCQSPFDARSAIAALSAAAGAISEAGRARQGDRTMLDTVYGFLEAFDAGLSADEVWQRLPRAVRRARDGAVATAQMKPRAGRAAYVGAELSSTSESEARPDPGAWAALIILRTVCRAVGVAVDDTEAEDAAVLGSG
uniref:Triokinase/FMN cyclase n=1 Tax=Macrostomum lignano TaxID=282301 RepID=A0A1I8J9Z0_9PLAT